MEERGEDSRGVKFGPYSEASKEMGYPQLKASMGKESRFINLNFEGDFHRQMDFKVDRNGIEIYSKDDKSDLMVKKYGIDIFGLNEKNFDWLFDEVFEHIYNRLKVYFT